jgi:hypothetical protein
MKRSNLNDNQLQLNDSNAIITFNDEQYEAIKKIRLSLLNKTSTFFTLAGYAGTGKSTVIKKIIDEYRRGVVVTAPTHKAKKVIMRTTGKSGQTLSKLLGLRPDVMLEDFNPNDPQFNPIAVPRITDYNLVIIDEASQVNSSLYDLIVRKTVDSKTKVLFMGDPAQIPPVGERASVVFDQTSNEIFWLKKIERQDDGNPLIPIYDNLRNNLYNLDGGFNRITKINSKGEGVIFTVNREEFREHVLNGYSSSEYKKNNDFCKLIAWKNKTVMLSNHIIRQNLFENSDDVVQVGDVLMGYRTIINEKMSGNIIENSADYVVIDRSNLEKNKYKLYGYNIRVREDLYNNHYYYVNLFIVDTKNEDNLHNYAELHDRLRDDAKKNKGLWKLYYQFRRDNILMRSIYWYRDGLQRSNYDVIVKDMDYGYALTCHKAQGSTYSHVFIIETDINDNEKIKERNQIRYVAFTRPTTSAVVLSNKIDIL